MPPAKKAASAAKKTAGPKAGGAKAAGQVMITLKQVAAELAESHNLAKRQAEAAPGDLRAPTTNRLSALRTTPQADPLSDEVYPIDAVSSIQP
jgi:hypothetical protein